MAWFKKKTKEESALLIKVKIAGLEKACDVLWKFELEHSYVLGKRDEIVDLEVKIAMLKVHLDYLVGGDK